MGLNNENPALNPVPGGSGIKFLTRLLPLTYNDFKYFKYILTIIYVVFIEYFSDFEDLLLLLKVYDLNKLSTRITHALRNNQHERREP